MSVSNVAKDISSMNLENAKKSILSVMIIILPLEHAFLAILALPSSIDFVSNPPQKLLMKIAKLGKTKSVPNVPSEHSSSPMVSAKSPTLTVKPSTATMVTASPAIIPTNYKASTVSR